jgi:alkanesulfonate monooxygenase SsuD/methylene tetrahydromethanopterin reductase-like flavin-dependent oxidoreductase (luciferase family)
MTQAIVGETQADFARNLTRVATADPFRTSVAELEEHHRKRRFPIGTGPEVRDRIAELTALGVERIYLNIGPYEEELLERRSGVLPESAVSGQRSARIANAGAGRATGRR